MASELFKAFYYDGRFQKQLEDFIQEKYNLPKFRLQITAKPCTSTNHYHRATVLVTFYLYGLKNKIMYIEHLAGGRNDCPFEVAQQIDYSIGIHGINIEKPPIEERRWDIDSFMKSTFKDRLMIINTVEDYPKIFDFKDSKSEFVVTHERALFLDKQMKSVTKLMQRIVKELKFDSDSFSVFCTNTIYKMIDGRYEVKMRYSFAVGSKYLNTFYEYRTEFDEDDFVQINSDVLSTLRKYLEN